MDAPTITIFISHSSRDVDAASAIVAALESSGVPCWIAPRNIAAGIDYNHAIMTGINACSAMLLLCSRHSVDSDPVRREVERAVARRVPVIPVWLEQVPLTPALEYMISTFQWVTAHPPPLERHLDAIVSAVRGTLAMPPADRGPEKSSTQYIGPYRLLEPPLGEGGMGTVFKAEQRTPVKRTVALKLIKAGFDTKEVIARFESERQALARMDHPHIAKVFDAGADSRGRPYFAMEYVPGQPITKFADDNKLSIKQRLELFMQVCDAISHAHTKAIIHRDIKASNVLAFLADGKPTVKVIDFGIAKALTGDRLTDRTFDTARGAAIGTYESMSPEQADGSPDIDTRTDVYSLGVLLYELLSGAKPFDAETLREAAENEARRIIREVEPPRPSTRLSSLGAGATVVAASRQSQIDALARQLCGELEWIPLKALRKERERRYASPRQLAQDIENYLAGKPLIAGPESAAYRVKKFLVRNKRPVITSAAAFVVITASVLTAFLVVQASERRAIASRDAERRAKEDAAIMAEKNGGLAVQLTLTLQKEKAALVAEKQTALALRYQVGAALLERAKGLEADQNHFAAAMTAAYAIGFDKATDANDPMHAFLPPGSSQWQAAAVICSGASCFPLWRSGGGISHEWGVTAVAFSPDGATLASGSWDCTIRLWDAHSGQLKNIIRGPVAQVLTICFSPDGKFLASGSWKDDCAVRLWDVATGKMVASLDGHTNWIAHVCFSPDGRTLASASGDRTVRLWNVPERKPIFTLEGHDGAVEGVSFAPDGKTVASAGRDKTIRLWSVETGKPLNVLRGHTRDVISVCYSPDGNTLVSGASDNTVRLWTPSTATLRSTLTGHTAPLWYVSVSPDGKTIASTSEDRTVRLWDLQTGEPLHTLSGHTGIVRCVSFSPDSKLIASGSVDQTVRLWDVRTGKPADSPQGHSSDVTSVAFSPNGKTLASASYDHTVRLWDAATGKPLKVLQGHSEAVWNVRFSADGALLASVSGDASVRLWRVSDGTTVATLHVPEAMVVCFRADGKVLASATRSGMIYLWEVPSGKLVQSFQADLHAIRALEFSPDGTQLVSAGDDRIIRRWDAVTAKPLDLFEGHGRPVIAMAFSPDGHTFASGSVDGTVHFLDTSTFKQSSILHTNSGDLESLAFSPDGRTLACAGGDAANRFLRLWDVGSGKITAVFHGHTDRINGVCFAPNGQTVASGSADCTVRLWEVPEKPAATLSGHSDSVRVVAFSPDGRKLVSASQDRTILLWPLDQNAKPVSLQGHSSDVVSFGFSRDGKTLLSASNDQMCLWNPLTGEIRATFKHPNEVVSAAAISPDGRIIAYNTREVIHVCDTVGNNLWGFRGIWPVWTLKFHPDGNILASGWGDGTIRLCNVHDGKVLIVLRGQIDGIASIDFSPDGKTLAAGSYDHAIRLWRVPSGEPLATLDGHNGAVLSVSFSPDGKMLASGSQDQTIMLWDLAASKPVATLRGHSSAVRSVSFSPDGKSLASGSDDHLVMHWRIPNVFPMQRLREYRSEYRLNGSSLDTSVPRNLFGAKSFLSQTATAQSSGRSTTRNSDDAGSVQEKSVSESAK